MNCKKCGSPLGPNDYYCGVCGEKVEKEGEAVVTEPVMKNNTALTLGIIGLILGSVVLGILAIVFSKKPNASNAKTAKILGIFAIVRAVIGVFYAIFVLPGMIEDIRAQLEVGSIIINYLLAF
ncbi:MAG TPA: zinc ribbon domain-containing protein [Acholeplasmataceae bacterium]|nr:zinc ribbon domain-containing protein [Acholeplasmataceae bacterium]